MTFFNDQPFSGFQPCFFGISLARFQDFSRKSFLLSLKNLMTFFSHQPFFLNFKLYILHYYYTHYTYFRLFYTLYPLYTHLHPIFPFPHLTFNSRNNKYYLLFFVNSSLHKQPFITAHFRSSLYILCITAR